MPDIRIRMKVAIGYAAALLVALTIGVVAYVSAQRVRTELDTVVGAQFPVYRAMAELQRGVRDAEAFLANIALSGATAEVFRRDACRGCHEDGTAFNRRVDTALGSIAKAAAEVDRLPQSGSLRKLWPGARGALQQWQGDTTRLRTLLAQRSQAGEAPGAGSGSDDLWTTWITVHQSGLSLDDSLVRMTEELRNEANASHASAAAAQTIAERINLVVLIGGALLMVVLGIVIGRSVQRGIEGVVQQSARLSAAASEGRLDVRGDEKAVQADFRSVIHGMNETLDAMAGPTRMAIDNVAAIGLGQLPPKITAQYRGEFQRVAHAINSVIDVVNQRNADIRLLTESALAGKLDVRADPSKYKGYNGKMIAALNAMLDAAVAPVQEATRALERLAQRDLRARVTGAYVGDHARVKDALNATAQALEEAIAQVAVASSQVSSAAEQIAASSQSLASGASEQAASLEETSASLESMASVVKRSADSARHANALAQSAHAVAAQGSDAMQKMTSAMQQIRSSAEGTSQIIRDINDIAFQTNLLALNAAVEAARAGEAGRGFAVVAEEVRSLALRSKEAASKTEALIRESVRQTGEGDATATQVAAKLAEIADNVGKVTGIVHEIAASSEEQANGIDEVTRAIGQMNHVTQQNAASAEESSSAAAELSGQSQELAAMVQAFRVGEGQRAAHAAPSSAIAAPPARSNGVAKRPAARA